MNRIVYIYIARRNLPVDQLSSDFAGWEPVSSIRAAAADLGSTGEVGDTTTLRKLPRPVRSEDWNVARDTLDDWKLGKELILTRGERGGVSGAGL